MAYRNKLFPHLTPPAEPQRSPTENELRGTGRSMAQAMRYIAMAMGNPGMEVRVRDHYLTHIADVSCFDMAVNIATKLGLQFLTFNRTQLTIRYDVLEWVS